MDRDQIHLQAALEAVATAASLTRAVQSGRDDISRHTKDDRSPVTVADYAAQAIVAMVLSEKLGKRGPLRIVGEESASALRSPEQAPVLDAVVTHIQRWRPAADVEVVLEAIDACGDDGQSQDFWTLDPVDGTKGFLRGQQYAIALARIENGQVVLGVLGCPNLPQETSADPAEADPKGTGSLYAAQLGAGTWEFPDADPTGSPLKMSCPAWTPAAPIRPCASVESGHSNRGATDDLLDRMESTSEPVRLDSQAKYAVLARGQANAYLRLPTRRDYVEKIWDHAAGALIASEAGAVVSDVAGAPLDFRHGRRLEANRGVIAAAAGLHEKLIVASMDLGLQHT